jgi:membrane-bound lytic murein transglycosylase B
VSPQPADDQRLSVIELEATDGPEYWVGWPNFYSITRYNHSALYAMAVFQLAQRIDGADNATAAR